MLSGTVVTKEPSSTCPAAERLRAELFEECGLGAPQEDVHFMLVCRVVLGFPAPGLEHRGSFAGASRFVPASAGQAMALREIESGFSPWSAQVYTTDGETAMPSPPTETQIEPGTQVFADSLRRELTTVKLDLIPTALCFHIFFVAFMFCVCFVCEVDEDVLKAHRSQVEWFRGLHQQLQRKFAHLRKETCGAKKEQQALS